MVRLEMAEKYQKPPTKNTIIYKHRKAFQNF